MAQIKRKKVSGKAVSGQKKSGDILYNKLFWLITGISLIVLIAVGITVGIVVTKLDDDTEETVDYIKGEHLYTPLNGEEQKITFTKMSYDGILFHVDEADYGDNTYCKHVFFFAYDFTQFYPDKSIDDGKDKDNEDDVFYYDEKHEDALKALCRFQYEINAYNATLGDDENNDKAVLYLVDLSIESNKNVLTSSQFGGSSDNQGTFAFGYIAGVDGFQGTCQTDPDNKKKTMSLYADSFDTFVANQDNYVKFIKNYKFEYDQAEKK